MTVLSYRDKKDRLYGATGSAIGLFIKDGEEMLHAIDLDAEAGEMMEMSDRFYYGVAPHSAVTLAWETTLKNFNLMEVMTIANALCRIIVGRGERPTQEVYDALFAAVSPEGQSYCSLEEDEMRNMFEKDFRHLWQIFNHSGVQSVARDFSRELEARRRMEYNEIIECLQPLTMF